MQEGGQGNIGIVGFAALNQDINVIGGNVLEMNLPKSRTQSVEIKASPIKEESKLRLNAHAREYA